MSTDLVPADNMSALNQLDPQAREVAVTRMLSEARSWLAHAVEATDPQSIATFKAQMATVAEATKQLNLSKGIQLDALEMVRRAERGMGLAIRKGQAEGTVATVGQRRTGAGGLEHSICFPSDMATKIELSDTNAGIYAMTDGVTDEQFDAALDDAKAEENVSRANVVRKIRGFANTGVVTRKQRAEKISELAEQGHTRTAIADKLGIHLATVANIAKEYGVDIPADSVTKRTVGFKSNDLLERAVGMAETLSRSIAAINPHDLDEGAESEIDALIQYISAVRKAANRIKESIS